VVELTKGVDAGRRRARVTRRALRPAGLSLQHGALPRTRCRLLDDVHQFVGDQSSAFSRVRRILAGAEHHVPSNRVSQRIHRTR